MKIGIVRHFKVDYTPKKFMNYKDFQAYGEDYDRAEVIENKVDIDRKLWSKCYCSDLPRAIKTAKSIYSQEVIVTELLREVKMYPVRRLSIKIPSFLWSISSRVAWKMDGKSQVEGYRTTRDRARRFISSLDLDKDENILIVSHGFFLITLVEELRKMGFQGKVPKGMKNGYLYVLEK